MSLPRFFLDEQVISEEVASEFELRLAADDVKHAKVLRLKPGEHIAVIDASLDYFECEIVDFSGTFPVVSITRHEGARPRPQVILLQGMAKGEKMDLVMRHATELGVSGIIPLACERSVLKLDDKKKGKRIERWQSIAKSAAMQSGQPMVATVGDVVTVKQAAQQLSSYDSVLIAWEEAPTTCALRSALDAGIAAHGEADINDMRIGVIVGPEGGISQNEVDILLACNPNARLVSLGSSILRTETAGIVAPALVLYELGCLGDRA